MNDTLKLRVVVLLLLSLPLALSVAAQEDEGGRQQVEGVISQDGVRPSSDTLPATGAGPPLNMVVRSADVILPPLEPADIPPVDADGPVQIGLVRELPKPVRVAQGTATSGSWEVSPAGTVWRLTLAAQGAQGMRVQVDEIALPAGAALYVYDAGGSRAHGPLPRHGPTLWTPTVFADAVTLELHVPAGAPWQAVSLDVAQIAHVYVAQADLVARPLGHAGACNLDVTCYPSWDQEAAAVAHYTLIKNGATYVCTGTLLNDLDGTTLEEYFLTANHCLADASDENGSLATQTVADTLDFFWFFQTSTCDGTPPSKASVPQTDGGGDLLYRETRNSGNDVAFLRLREVPPAGVYWAGWTTGTPTSVVGIHHPRGEYKRIAFGARTGSSTNYWDVVWSDGTTEGGSSGSALFDSNGRVTGHLWGGAASCDNQDGIDKYGRFNQTYPNVDHWLEIGGTINVDHSYTGTEVGTPDQPFDTVSEGNNLAWDGVRLKVQGGNYPESVLLSTEMLLISENGSAVIGE